MSFFAESEQVMRYKISLFMVCGMLLPIGAAAQSGGWDGRARVSVSAGAQMSETAHQSLTLVKNVENASFDVALPSKHAPFFDGGVMIRLRRHFGVNASVSVATSEISGDLTGQVPHPLFFNQPRQISGTVGGLSRTETAVHVDAAYMPAAGRRLVWSIFGGVTIVHVGQTMVSDVIVSETYPFDTATFSSAATTDVSKTGVGANAGVDLTWKLSRSFGVGALVRYSRANITMSTAAGNSADINAGGLQAGGGVRFAF